MTNRLLYVLPTGLLLVAVVAIQWNAISSSSIAEAVASSPTTLAITTSFRALSIASPVVSDDDDDSLTDDDGVDGGANNAGYGTSATPSETSKGTTTTTASASASKSKSKKNTTISTTTSNTTIAVGDDYLTDDAMVFEDDDAGINSGVNSTTTVSDDDSLSMTNMTYTNSTFLLPETEQPKVWPTIVIILFVGIGVVMCIATAVKNYKRREGYTEVPSFVV